MPKLRILIIVSVINLCLCFGYAVFAWLMRGMAHSDSSEHFAQVISLAILAYAAAGSVMLAMVCRKKHGRLVSGALTVWNLVLLLAFSGVLPVLFGK